MSWTLLGGFAIACFFSCIAPGAAVALVITQSLRHSARRSAWGILGLQVVTMLKYALTGFGLAGLLAMSPGLFAALRIAGAIYLVCIAIRMLREPPGPATGRAGAERADLGPGAAFRQGAVTQFCNPYSAFFYLSLVPQFLDTRRPLWPQLGMLLAATILIDVTVLGAYALGAASLARATSGRAGRLLNILAAIAMLAVAFRIAIW